MDAATHSKAVGQTWVTLGGVGAIIGSVGYMAAGAIHQDLPSGPENAIPHVAGRDEWHAIHLLVLIAVALWPVAFKAVEARLATPLGQVFARMAIVAMIIGYALYAIEMALDGFALKAVADQWAAASGPEQDALFERGATVYAVLNGTFRVSGMWVLGIPFILLGTAIAFDDQYPRWMGWTGAILGGVPAAYMVTEYLSLDAINELLGFVIPAFLLAVWLAALGWMTLRRVPNLP